MDENGMETFFSSDTPQSLYIANLYTTLDLILWDDPSQFDAWEEAWNERLQKLDKSDVKDPEKTFFRAEMLIHGAFAHLKFGHELEAGWLLRQAWQRTINSIEQFPGFKPHLKTVGLLHVLIGTVPDKYSWLLSLLGMEGSIEEGLAELELYIQSAGPLTREVTLLLDMIHAYLLSNGHYSDSVTLYAPTRLELFVKLLVHLKNSNGTAALESFRHLDRIGFRYPFLHYLGGEVYLRKGEYPLAAAQYEKFISRSRGISHIRDAHYKVFLAYHLSDDPVNAQKYFDLAQSEGEARSEADKHATRSLKTGKFPDPLIMKIRLLTDGGHYRKADSLVQAKREVQFTSTSDSVEFIYRQARLAHQQDKLRKAISLYKEVIDRSPEKGWYFAPNSCLQLGLIFSKHDDHEQAEYYLKKVRTYSKHAYKQSLDHKARTALNKL